MRNDKVQWRQIYESMVLSALLTVLFFGGCICPLLMNRFVGDYRDYDQELYRAWYEIYIDAEQQLIRFSRPHIGEWGITARYKYNVADSIIKQKYECLFESLRWKEAKGESGTMMYEKGDLICDLTRIDANVWEVRIRIRGFGDKGVVEKIIYGNKK